MSTRSVENTAVALVVGIGNYYHSDRIAGLACARADAEELTRRLTDPEVANFPIDSVRLLLDEDADRSNLISSLSRWLIEKACGARLALVYFAGHGMINRVGQLDDGFLLPYDADPENLLDRGIAMKDVAKWLGAIEAESVVVCLDCCHAGSIVTRDAADKTAHMPRNIGIRPSALNAFEGKNRFLIASCDENQVSIESPQLGHGLFTYHLLEGISGAGDQNGDGCVGVNELFDYVSKSVRRDSIEKFGLKQSPWTSSMGQGDVIICKPKRQASDAPAQSTRHLNQQWDQVGAVDFVKFWWKEVDRSSPDLIASMLRVLRPQKHAAGVPLAFRMLAHNDAPVREVAKKVIHEFGWSNAVEVVEKLARSGDASTLAAILDGLNALQAHKDVVSALDRLVSTLSGDLRNRAISILDRKQLVLSLEDIRSFFLERDSHYEITEVLGQGLFTAAYLAQDRDTGKERVLRVLRPEFAVVPSVRAEFLDVSTRAEGYIHPNLVLTRTVRSFSEAKIYYAVRDYLPGETLQEKRDRGDTLTLNSTIIMLQQIALGLSPIHDAGDAHRGVKPSNIFMLDNNRTILGDPSLGIPTIGAELSRLSYDYRYTAPELFRSQERCGPSSDFYSLGCVAYELVCGRPPFTAEHPTDLMVAHCTAEPPLPRSLNPDMPEAFEELLMYLLQKSPSSRPRGQAELHEWLARLASTVPVEEKQPTGLRQSVARSDMARSIIGIDPSASILGSSSGKLVSGSTFFLQDSAPWNTLMPSSGESGSIGEKIPSTATTPKVMQYLPLNVDDIGAKLLSFEIIRNDQWAVALKAAMDPIDVEGVLRELQKIPSHREIRGEATIPALTEYQVSQILSGNLERLRFHHYLVLEELGRGGMGAVFKVWNANLQRPEAIKTIHLDQTTAQGQLAERFEREARVLAQLNHPNITTIYQFGHAHGVDFLAMEYVRGRDLYSIVKESEEEGEKIPLWWASERIVAVAGALQHAHDLGIVHRDIKPSNIMITDNDELKILDLGIARLIHPGENDTSSTLITRERAVIGTPAFMPPEQWGDATSVTPQSDIYSLGCTFFYLLTGRMPFDSDRISELMMAHCNEIAPRVSKFRRDIPKKCDQVISKMLQKNPDDRYRSCKDLIEALEPFCSDTEYTGGRMRWRGNLIEAREPFTSDTSKRRSLNVKSNGTLIKWLVAALVGAVIAILGYWMLRT